MNCAHGVDEVKPLEHGLTPAIGPPRSRRLGGDSVDDMDRGIENTLRDNVKGARKL